MMDITKTAAAVIIHKFGDSTKLFMEFKGDKYPLPEFRNCLCLIGGHWIGPDAKADKNPRETLKREILEELSLEKTSHITSEMKLIDPNHQPISYEVEKCKAPIEEKDVVLLEHLKSQIVQRIDFFREYVSRFEGSSIEQTTYVSYFTSSLLPGDWDSLTYLQEKYGNLSNESVSQITDLGALSNGARIGFGHAQVLKDFFSARGYSDRAFCIRPMEEVHMCAIIGDETQSYQELMQKYKIIRHPL